MFYASARNDTILIDAIETNVEGAITIGDRFFPINTDEESGSVYYVFKDPTGSNSTYGGLVFESTYGQFALVNNASLSGASDLNITTSTFSDLNLRNLYGNSLVVVGTDSTTGTISNIGGGIIEIASNGIRVPAFSVQGGVLNSDSSGNITSVPLGSLDIPIPYSQVAVGNIDNYLGSTTSLEVVGTTTKAIDITGSTAFFQTIIGVSSFVETITGTNAYFNNITGTHYGSITGTTANFNTVTASDFSGNSAYLNSITGSDVFVNNIYTNDLTGNSAYFTVMSGSSETFDLETVGSITGCSATFNSITGGYISFNSFTGGTGTLTSLYVENLSAENLLFPSSQSVPDLTTIVHTGTFEYVSQLSGSSSYFDSITGIFAYFGTVTSTNEYITNLTTVTHTGMNDYITNLTTTTHTGINDYITNLTTTTHTGMNDYVTNLTTTTHTGVFDYISQLSGSSSYFTSITGIDGYFTNLTGNNIFANQAYYGVVNATTGNFTNYNTQLSQITGALDDIEALTISLSVVGGLLTANAIGVDGLLTAGSALIGGVSAVGGALSAGSASLSGLLSSASAEIGGALSAVSASFQGYQVVDAGDNLLMSMGDAGLDVYPIGDDVPLLNVSLDPSLTLNCTGYFTGGIQCSTGIFSGLTTTNITGNSAYFTTINGINITGISFANVTGGSAYFSSITGLNIYANTYTGTNMWIDSITGVSAHFIAYTGNKITASQIMVTPNITGNSAFFTTITGYNEYLQQLTVAGTGSFNAITANTYIGLPLQGNVVYFFNHSLSSSLTGYRLLSASTDGHAETTTVYAMTGAESNLLVESYATDIGDPNVTNLLNGDWSLNEWVTTSNGTQATTYTTISHYRNGTLLALLGTYNSITPTSTNNEIDIDLTLPQVPWVPTTDQLVIQFYASETGSSRTLTFYWEGSGHYTHIHTPIFQLFPSQIPTLAITNTTDSTSTTTGVLTVAGGLGVADSIYSTNLNCFTANITNLNSTNVLASNAFTGVNCFLQNMSVGTATGVNSFLTNLLSTNFTGSNSYITTMSGTQAYFTHFTGVNCFLQNISVGTATGTNSFLSNLVSTNFTGVNESISSISGTSAYFTSLTGKNAYISSISGTSAYFTSFTGVNESISSISGTSAYFTTITGGSMYISNLLVSTITGTNAYFSNLIGATGPTGPTGLTGATGATGPTGPLGSYFTFVTVTGTNEFLTNLVTTTHTGTNEYLTNIKTTTITGTFGYIPQLSGSSAYFNAMTGSTLALSSTTPSTSTTTGALTVAGGVGISGNIDIGSYIFIVNNDLVIGTDLSNLNSYLTRFHSDGAGASTNYLNFLMYGQPELLQLFSSYVKIASTTASTSATTGALVVNGGVGIGGNVYIGGNLHTGDFIFIVNNSLVIGTDLSASNSFLASFHSDGAGASTNYLYFIMYGGSTLLELHSNYVQIDPSTASSSTTTGALVVNGGVGIAGNLNVGGTVGLTSLSLSGTTDSSSTSTGTLIVDGGAGIAKNLYVGGNVYLPTTGGTSTALNYYEELASFTLTFTGLWASNQNTNCHFVRVGSQVTMMIEAVNATANTSTVNHFTSTNAIPARFRPAIILNLPCVLIDNGADVLGGMLGINLGGVTVTLITGGNFINGQGAGFEAQSFSWTTI